MDRLKLALLLLLLHGCALRVGNRGMVVNEGPYPPAGVRTFFCLPCLEFDGFGIGLMFVGPWPILGYIE